MQIIIFVEIHRIFLFMLFSFCGFGWVAARNCFRLLSFPLLLALLFLVFIRLNRKAKTLFA